MVFTTDTPSGGAAKDVLGQNGFASTLANSSAFPMRLPPVSRESPV